jgi:glycosyltransferase involved in cell wall biosynthesis
MNPALHPPGVPPALTSVVVPVYNAERYLAEAIESVLAQTWPHWELLLVDDGSSDRSPEIARSYVERHPDKMRYLEHPGRANRGESATRNVGLREGRGEFFAFLDADDVWLPEKLERQLPLLDAHPEAGWLYGNTLYWFDDPERDYAPHLGLPAGALVRPPHLVTSWLRRQAAVPCTCSLLVRREVVERSGGFDESFRSMYADQVFYARLALTAPALVDDGIWELYRQHTESAVAVSKRRGTGREARWIYLTWLQQTLQEQNLTAASDPTLWRALRWQVRLCRHPRLDRVVRRLTR